MSPRPPLRPLAADPDALRAHQLAELPQKDDLCGAFWGLAALRAAGVDADPRGASLDQDTVAVAAGTHLSPPPRDRWLPPGEAGRDDYRIALPLDAEDSGSSGAGVAEAIRTLSGGALDAVPVTGRWSAERLRGLLDAVSALTPVPVAVLANVHTGELWPAGVSDEDRARYLRIGDDTGPVPDWSVGHFVALTAIESGGAGTLVDVADTYRSRGEEGLHRQPVQRLAAALAGPDKVRGLLVVVAGDGQRVRDAVTAAGLEVRPWDRVAT